MAADYYRDVCLPAWSDKWDSLLGEIDLRYDWLASEKERIEVRDGKD